MDELDESDVVFDEAYVLVADQRRVSRNVRFSWYTDALSGKNDPYDRQAPLHIIGQMPPTNRNCISTKTDVHFLFQRYRYVFMFDFSSSAFRINDLTYKLIVDELLDAFKKYIKELLTPFKVPGQFDDNVFSPQVFCTVIGYLGEERGHIVFEQDRLLSQRTYDDMLASIERQLNTAFENYDCNAGCDEGLVPMLRTGLIALQLLPSNCLAGIVVITDACTDVYGELSYNRTQDRDAFGSITPGENAINEILSQMRNQTISCSFIQVLEHSTKHSMGLMPNQNLLKFVSSATSGMYILMDTNTLNNWPPSFWWQNRKTPETINPIVRGLFCWGFQKGLKCSRYLPESDCYWDVTNTETRRWDPDECLKYPVDTIEDKQIILFQRFHEAKKLSVNLLKLVECHLREGYMIQGMSDLIK